MTEERRIIVSEHGALSCSYPTDNNIPVWEFSKNFPPEPITKSELKNIVTNHMFGLDSQIIDFIGVDEFWNKYGKPVPDKKWYVKVPHLKDVYYCICHTEGEEDLLRTCDPYIVDTYPIDVCEVRFTEAEIKKFHLEDCKKVPVDG